MRSREHGFEAIPHSVKFLDSTHAIIRKSLPPRNADLLFFSLFPQEDFIAKLDVSLLTGWRLVLRKNNFKYGKHKSKTLVSVDLPKPAFLLNMELYSVVRRRNHLARNN
jgi:hypothetical protein